MHPLRLPEPGEAGKGFAVVADEIRQLADQNKDATENITAIVDELNEFSNEASDAIRKSLDATESQTGLIEEASDGFIVIDENMKQLTMQMNNINEKIEALKISNNMIVESIMQLSTVSGEITASSVAASKITDNNKSNSKDAKEMLQKVLDFSHQLDKYMKISQNHEVPPCVGQFKSNIRGYFLSIPRMLQRKMTMLLIMWNLKTTNCLLYGTH